MTSPHRVPVSLYTLSSTGQLRPHTSIPSPYNLTMMNSTTRFTRNNLLGSTPSTAIVFDSPPIIIDEDRSADESYANIERANDGFDVDVPVKSRDVYTEDVRRAELVVFQAFNRVKEARYALKLGLVADVKKAEEEHTHAIHMLKIWRDEASDAGVKVDAIHPNTIVPSPSLSHKRHFKDVVKLPPDIGIYSSNPDQFTADEAAVNRAHAAHWRFGDDPNNLERDDIGDARKLGLFANSSSAASASINEFIDNAVASSSQSQHVDNNTMDVYSQDPQGPDTVDQHRVYRDWIIAKQRERYANIAKPRENADDDSESLSSSQLLEQLE
jgi:hypothetical protein